MQMPGLKNETLAGTSHNIKVQSEAALSTLSPDCFGLNLLNEAVFATVAKKPLRFFLHEIYCRGIEYVLLCHPPESSGIIYWRKKVIGS